MDITTVFETVILGSNPSKSTNEIALGRFSYCALARIRTGGPPF